MPRMRANWNNIAIVISLVFVVWVFYKLSRATYNNIIPASSSTTTSSSPYEAKDISRTRSTNVESTESKLQRALKKIEELKKSLAGKGQDIEKRDIMDLPAEAKRFTGHKLIHLDLKGAPPKMAYLIKLLPFFKAWGATGLLIEYEDMFPYHGELEVIRTSIAYSQNEIAHLLEACQEQGLVVVPLVQTFGHLEFVLKNSKFAKLRETQFFTNSLCPNNNGSVPLVKMMIDQVLESHPGIKWFHVGGDEVWNLKTCDVCVADKRNKAQLFVHHMTSILKHVKSKNVVPLMWDDMMRHWDIEHLKSLSDIVEPMVWAYYDNLYGYFPPGMWDRYAQAFPKMWAASAFKGATKPDSNYVPIGFHVDNNQNWLKIMSNLPETTQMEGIALTGWSRYDHYATLCELLPAGLPSLDFCIGVLNKGSLASPVKDAIEEQLGLPKDFIIYVRSYGEDFETPTAKFPGHEIYTLVGKLKKALYRLDGITHLEQGWMLKREVNEKFLSYFHITRAHNFSMNAVRILKELKSEFVEPLNEIYHEKTVKEWMKDKIEDKLAEAEFRKKQLGDLKVAAANNI